MNLSHSESGEELACARANRKESGVNDDYAVQLTNDNATECKLAAVNLRYWQDPYIACFMHEKPERKDPEISRGYWARIVAVRTLLNKCINEAGKSCQVVNLGAGFDTLYWYLCDSRTEFANFTEVDFSSVTCKKIHHILKQPKLYKSIAQDVKDIVVKDHTDLHGEKYDLVGADLRQTEEVIAKLKATNLDFSKPTIFICECVLIYMASTQSATLLSLLSKTFTDSCFINYEQVNLDDKFGSVMKEHLHNRGLSLAGLKPCSDLASQKKRFVDSGWNFVRDWSMTTVYKQMLCEKERMRIEKLEMLDEAELLFQLMDHYCIVFAANGNTFNTVSFK